MAEAKWKIKKWPPFCRMTLTNPGVALVLWVIASPLRFGLAQEAARVPSP